MAGGRSRGPWCSGRRRCCRGAGPQRARRFKAIFIGIIEGITEWLPVSSTGHMILVDEFVKLKVSPEFKEVFFVVIQLGAIFAILGLYFNKLNPFSSKKTSIQKKNIFSIWSKIFIGVLPAGILGFILDDWLDEHFYNYQTVASMLILYGIFFIIVENRNKKVKIEKFKNLDYKTAFYIGMFQVLALIPGTSRSGATILGAVILGTSRTIAVKFSFFLSIPVMFGASALKLVKLGRIFSAGEFLILISAMISAFLISVISIRLLFKYIKKHDFKIFGWYRIILGILMFVYFITK